MSERNDERDRLLAALKAIIETGDDCPACDRGVLRHPENGHWPTCPFGNAQLVVAEVERLRAAQSAHGSTTATEPYDQKAERVFQAVVYAYEGREVPEDLLTHGMVRRALKFRASHGSATEATADHES